MWGKKDDKPQQKPPEQKPIEVKPIQHDCSNAKTWDNRHKIWYCCICGRRM